MPRKQAPEFFGVSFFALYFLVLSSPESSVWNNNCQNAGMNIEGWNAHHFPKEWFQHRPQFMEAFHFQSFHYKTAITTTPFESVTTTLHEEEHFLE
jgi:hypothetical protein